MVDDDSSSSAVLSHFCAIYPPSIFSLCISSKRDTCQVWLCDFRLVITPLHLC